MVAKDGIDAISGLDSGKGVNIRVYLGRTRVHDVAGEQHHIGRQGTDAGSYLTQICIVAPVCPCMQIGNLHHTVSVKCIGESGYLYCGLADINAEPVYECAPPYRYKCQRQIRASTVCDVPARGCG